jgi:DUF4097 and DUF4098 domain-containing protein YvlB
MKTIASAFAITSIGFAFLSGCNTPQFSAKRDFQKVIPINSRVDVNVETFNGNITVTPTDQSEIELVAHIKTYGYTQEEADAALETVVPEIDTTTSAISIECKKRNQALMYSDSVSFELKVPVSWPLHLVTSNGGIKTSQSRGPVTANTSNGKIEIKEAVGALQLSTSNGKIIVDDSAGNIQASSSNGVIQLIGCSLEGKCKLDTSNGAISVSLSDRTPVRLDASTSNGSIKFNAADIDLTTDSKSHIAGVLFGKANGTAPTASLDLETSNGSITITTASEPAPPKSSTSEAKAVSL